MNFYTIAARMEKTVQKRIAENDVVWKNLVNEGYMTAEQRQQNIESNTEYYTRKEKATFLKTCELGIDLMSTFKEMVARKSGTIDGGKVMMLTVRPPPGANWAQFKHHTDQFINKWKNDWMWYEYAFEQKGETLEELGKGFHVHIILSTMKKNYYASHIVRDASKAWTNVATNCIQVDTLKNVERGRQYIRGIKNDTDKAAAVAMDSQWRSQNNLQDLYTGGSSPTPRLQE